MKDGSLFWEFAKLHLRVGGRTAAAHGRLSVARDARVGIEARPQTVGNVVHFLEGRRSRIERRGQGMAQARYRPARGRRTAARSGIRRIAISRGRITSSGRGRWLGISERDETGYGKNRQAGADTPECTIVRMHTLISWVSQIDTGWLIIHGLCGTQSTAWAYWS